jgi:hypothetical protein
MLVSQYPKVTLPSFSDAKQRPGFPSAVPCIDRRYSNKKTGELELSGF